MKIVALIPIKLNSERIPFKNIKKFHDGTPLINFIQKECLKSKFINEIYIYCADNIIKYCLKGVKYLKRPRFLDEKNINANDIINEFMKNVDADIYVNVHTTAPFAKAETIDDCIEKVISKEYDSAFCAESIKTFMWKDGKPLNFDPNKFPRTQDLPLIYGETSNAYVFSKETFKKYKRRVGVNPYIKEIAKIEAMDIDYPEDFDICYAIYKEIKK